MLAPVLPDEDIVHALSNEWVNMNKVSLAEAGDGSPPFWSFGQTDDFLIDDFLISEASTV